MMHNESSLPMDTRVINVLVTSFEGLGLPKLLCIPIVGSTSVKEFETQLSYHLHQVPSRLILTTTSRREVSGCLASPISSLLSCSNDTFLPLRLSTELCGGKGGFGSQLRAAGGRMSSRRKKNQGDSNSSNRNLDGRRLRTVAEAKALAEYLALKPDMDKMEKEARRNRWEHVIELAEMREAEARTLTKARVDMQWSTDKEEVEEKTREAVLQALRVKDYPNNLATKSPSRFELGSQEDSSDIEISSPNEIMEEAGPNGLGSNTRIYHGFDEEDDNND